MTVGDEPAGAARTQHLGGAADEAHAERPVLGAAIVLGIVLTTVARKRISANVAEYAERKRAAGEEINPADPRAVS